MNIHYIPRGSWLAARLAQLVGGQEQFAPLVHEGKTELHLDIDVIEAADNSPVGVFRLIFNREMMQLEGRCQRGQDRLIADDFQAVLCSSALSVAPCIVRLGGVEIGWDGKQYFGEGIRRSRFADLRDEEEKQNTLKNLKAQFQHGDDSVANDPALMTRIAKYLERETADCEFIAGNLKYVRSALCDDCPYWIWDYQESDGTPCYVTLRLGSRSVLAVRDADELSPEQHIYAMHHKSFEQ